MVPSTRAIAVAHNPTTTELPRARHMPALDQASDHHFNVKPVGGKANVLEALKALISTSSSGA